MNAKISVLVICIEAILYLLLNHLYDCIFTILLTINFFLRLMSDSEAIL